jgi:hypothetical protein
MRAQPTLQHPGKLKELTSLLKQGFGRHVTVPCTAEGGDSCGSTMQRESRKLASA